MVVETPLLALIGVALSVVLSSRVNDPRAAQQTSTVLVVPVLALLFGQLAGVIVLGAPLALGIGVVLATIAAGGRADHRRDREGAHAGPRPRLPSKQDVAGPNPVSRSALYDAAA